MSGTCGRNGAGGPRSRCGGGEPRGEGGVVGERDRRGRPGSRCLDRRVLRRDEGWRPDECNEPGGGVRADEVHDPGGAGGDRVAPDGDDEVKNGHCRVDIGQKLDRRDGAFQPPGAIRRPPGPP